MHFSVIKFCTLTVLCLLCLTVRNEQVFALGSDYARFPVGMHTYGVFKEGKERIDIAVWYPAITQGRPRQIEGWQVSSAGATRPRAGFFPIVLMSHDTASSRFANNDIAAAIASVGNIVIAVTHDKDNIISSGDLYSAKLFINRPRQILLALETVLDSPLIGPHADESRIGLVGVGFGAITALQIAGVSPHISNLEAFCKRQPTKDIFCTSWSGQQLEAANTNFPKLISSYGNEALTPALDGFAPELEIAPPSLSKEIPLEAKELKKEGFFSFFKKWGKSEELANKESIDQNTKKSDLANIASSKDPIPSNSFMDFQGGKLLGGTISGSNFVLLTLESATSTFYADTKKRDVEVTAQTPKKKIRTTLRRPANIRHIQAIALIAPSGGMFFENSTEKIPESACIIAGGDDTLYPYDTHGKPYEQLFTSPPQVEVLSGVDHFSFFAPCTKELLGTLEEVCGKVRGDDRINLAKANKNFLSAFFASHLGGAHAQPEPVEYFFVPKKKEPAKPSIKQRLTQKVHQNKPALKSKEAKK